jgi:fucose permease
MTSSRVLTTPRRRTETAGVLLLFGVNGALFAGLLPWYPDLKDRLDLSAGQFGLVVAAFAVGALGVTWLPGTLVRRVGQPVVLVWGTALLGVALTVGAVAPTGAALTAALLLVGAADATVDVTQNVRALDLQHLRGASVINRAHAVWSGGAALGGAAATGARAAGVPVLAYVGAAAVVGIAMTVLAERASRAAPGGEATRETEGDRDGDVSGGAAVRSMRCRVTALALVAICGASVEDFANNWSTLALAERGAGDAAGVALVAMLSAQCLGRLTGDRLVDRWGRARVARAGGALVASGGVVVVLVPWAGAATAGLALAGLGCATLVPGAFAAAHGLPSRDPARTVALVSWLQRVGFLVASPLVGLVAEWTSIRSATSVLVVVGVVVVLLAGALGSARRTTVPGSVDSAGRRTTRSRACHADEPATRPAFRGQTTNRE